MKPLIKNSVIVILLFGTTIYLPSCKKEVTLPVVSTTIVSDITQTTALITGTIKDDGGAEITETGICWSIFPNPAISYSKKITGTGVGSITTTITGLLPNTTYYARVYAMNREGISYGNEIIFLTSSFDPPTLTTVLIEATESLIVLGVNITGEEGAGEMIIERGVCYGIEVLPTIEGLRLSNGAGLGSFTIDLFNLNPGTTYFARAYAVNSSNQEVFYGNQISFVAYQVSGVSGGDFPGGGRAGAVSFGIGTKIYIGLGISNSDFPTNDFWEWDPETRIWTELARFPGDLGNETIGFSIGTKGYLTSSIWSVNGFLTNTFWEYDPSANKWTQKASLPTTPGRGSAVGFSIGTKGYIGIGFKEEYNGLPVEYLSDFWEWDQLTDLWVRKADFPGNQRIGAVGFSIGNKGYIGTGSDGTSLSDEFWEWDQATDVWTRKADFGGGTRAFAVGFSIGNKGYILTGINSNEAAYLSSDFWEFDQTTNTWAKINDFAGGPRYDAFGASIGNKAYIGTGYGYNSYLEDFWEFDPNI